LKLKKLELYGFKSFADRVEIDFDEGITGVVGPNGSGKSNIGDAMRWVLGEQSARSLRGAKMQDIIFNGTDDRRPQGYCEVTLVLDNSDRKLPIEFSEVSVGRRYYRSGESEYYINRSACRLKDVIDLFRDTGIGRKGYSIVGQGQIDEILSHKAEDRRDVFHEAAGIMKYRARRDEAQRRLETTRGNLQRLEDIIEEMERQLRPLQRQAKNAHRYIELQDRLKDIEINLFLREYDKHNNSIEETSRKISDAEASIGQSRRLSEELEQKIAELSGRYEQEQINTETMRTQVEELHRGIDYKMGEERLLQERIIYIEQTRMRLEGEADYDLKRAQELLKEAEELFSALEASELEQQTRREDIAAREQGIRDLQQKLDDSQRELDEKKEAVYSKINAMSDVKAAVSRYSAMLEALQGQLDGLNENLDAYARQDEIFADAGREIESRLGSLNASLKELQSAINETASRMNEMRERERKALEQQRGLENELQSAQARHRMLISMQNEHEGFSHAVRYLLGSPSAKNIVEGVVAELIEVPQEYVQAVETALGSAMQNIVTKTDDDAKALIRMLRQSNAGRATFLPMSSMSGHRLAGADRRILSNPGCIGVAAELIHCKDKYSEIIFNLLGRTIVCRDLDAATALARESGFKYKFVTLKGDVVNAGGSMAGGSLRSNSVSLLGRQSEIDQLAAQIAGINAELEAYRRSSNALAEDILQLEAKISADTERLNECRITIARENERRDKLADSVAQHNQKRGETLQSIERINSNIQDVQESIRQSENSMGDIGSENDSIREQIQRSQADINQKREELDSLVEHLNNMKLALAADTRERRSLRDKAESLKRDADRLKRSAQDKIDQSNLEKDHIAQQEKNRADNTGSIENDTLRLSELEQELQDQIARREEINRQLSELKKQQSSVREQLEDLNERKHGLELAVQQKKLELETMQNRIWDYYELTYGGALALYREDFSPEGVHEEIEDIRRRLRAMGTVNVNAVEDYAELNERYTVHVTQRDDLVKAENDLLGIIEDLNRNMKKVFTTEFESINEYFKETFKKLFNGGRAHLELSDKENILESGIEIVAQPPGKKLQLLSLLSGGEKALTATALLFAMLKHRPSPFCVLDEIEAALDDANLGSFAGILKEYAENTQFVVITHRKPTMESCDTLYGVTMKEKGVSKMISVRISDYA